MQHHFNTEIAQKHGTFEAIFLENVAFWILHNKANEKHFYEDKYWTYNSQNAFRKLFPYWTRQNLRTIINSCVSQGLLIIGNFNKANYDHTHWYALTEKGLSLFTFLSDSSRNQPIDWLESTNRQECGLQGGNDPQTRNTSDWLESTNGVVGINQPIPDRKPDRKQKIKDKELVLPDWLDKEQWEEFIEFRKEIKKPMSAIAMRRAITELTKLRSAGNDPIQVINNSILNSWPGLWPLKKQPEQKKSAIYGCDETTRPRGRDFTQERLDRETREVSHGRDTATNQSRSHSMRSAKDYLLG
jgi:hypothetical protein